MRSCRDCGSRNSRPKEIVPPLRSVAGGVIGDRWALDFAGPLPVTPRGHRYVVVLVEYLSKMVVAVPVKTHDAATVAQVLLDQVVFRFGPFRELMCDNAAEFVSVVVRELIELLQAKQQTPVPYRPNLLGLVELFNRTWKDMVAMYVEESQRDWDEWISMACYAYNASRHTTTGFAPFAVMFGREARTPDALLRPTSSAAPASVAVHHRQLKGRLERIYALVQAAIRRGHAAQARQYNKKQRLKLSLRPGLLVWFYNPPRLPGVTKLRHAWRGPMRVVEPAGYDNYLLEEVATEKKVIAHASFLYSFVLPDKFLLRAEQDLKTELDQEDEYDAVLRADGPDQGRGASAVAPAPGKSGVASRAGPSRTAAAELLPHESSQLDVGRRRMRRNRVGRYVAEVEWRDADGNTTWINLAEYDARARRAVAQAPDQGPSGDQSAAALQPAIAPSRGRVR